MGVWWGVDNSYASEGVGGGVGSAGSGHGVIGGWTGGAGGVSEANAGDTGECEEVRLVRMGAGMDETGYAGGDAPVVQGCCSVMLDEGDGGKDGVSGR